MFFFNFPERDEIKLFVADVDGLDIIEKIQLAKKTKDQLINWLKFRGDSLKGLHTACECRTGKGRHAKRCTDF